MNGLGHNIINIILQDIIQIVFIWVMNWLGLSLGIVYFHIKSMYDLTLELCNSLLSLL